VQLVINSREIDAFTPPEETVNLKCDNAMEALAERNVPLICYSAWTRREIISDGGGFFTHFVAEEGKRLYIGRTGRHLAKFDTEVLDGAIQEFVNQHPDVGMSIDGLHHRVVCFEINDKILSKQRAVHKDCQAVMASLVADDDQFVVDAYDEGLGIFRKLSLAFTAANAALGWNDKIHLLITNDLGEQSLSEVANVVISVDEKAVKDADGLAEILEWIVSLYD
jgi:hypothetical protein